MGSRLETLETGTTKRSSGDRSGFAQLLSPVLDDDSEMDGTWATEIERRITDVESGATQVIPMRVVVPVAHNQSRPSYCTNR